MWLDGEPCKEDWLMINTKDINEARKEIQKLVRAGEKIVVYAQDDDFNRKIFEIKNVDMVVGLEIGGRDRLKQRGSGMNEVIAKLAKSNDIEIGIDLSKIKELNLLIIQVTCIIIQVTFKLFKSWLLNYFMNI